MSNQTTIDTGSPAVNGLVGNITESLWLGAIHTLLTGTDPGRRHHVEVLNKSAIILIVACWEAFVEDLARDSSEHLLNNISDPQFYPSQVRLRIAQHLRTIKDERRVWDLAGPGWIQTVRTHTTFQVREFHNPTTRQVNLLLENTTGIKSLSSSWVWPRRSNAAAIKALDALVARRHEIAHHVATTTPVHKAEVRRAAELVQRLAQASSNYMRLSLYKVTKVEPWPEVRYSGLPDVI